MNSVVSILATAFDGAAAAGGDGARHSSAAAPPPSDFVQALCSGKVTSASSESTTALKHIYSTVFQFEEQFFNSDYVRQIQGWMYANWYKSILYAALYLLITFTGQSLMRNRPKFELRPALAAWNTMLALFSIFGFCRVLPEFIFVLRVYGLEYSMCNNSNAYGVAGYWTWLFCLSKVPELLDTLFIVLRKQRLIFLHWFHHSTVLIYTWYSYHDFTASGRWFIVMNYAVHATMYSYYALKTLKFNVPIWISKMITIMQLCQMLVGCSVNYMAWQIKQQRPCAVSDENIQYSFIMYFAYFILFAHFFIKAYLTTDRFRTKPPAKTRQPTENNHTADDNNNKSKKHSKQTLTNDACVAYDSDDGERKNK